MGDRSHMQAYSELLAFLQERGSSLRDFGSAEHGLSLVDARAFLPMLRAKGVAVSGIELWRKSGANYSLRGQDVWVPTGRGIVATHADAAQYLATIEAGPSDLLAVQLS